MGKYLKEAKHHAEKIQHYYDHAGIAGYPQAEYHSHQISELIGRAYNSKKGKGDVPAIMDIRAKTDKLMEEMKKRASGTATDSE